MEREHFPAIPGEDDGGFIFDEEGVELALDEVNAMQEHAFAIVAEVAGEARGYAFAVPFPIPGSGLKDFKGTVLSELAVNEAQRRKGIGQALLAEIEKRARATRQNVIVAHVPSDAVDFYRACGWDVYPAGRGFAWLPFQSQLRMDFPDPDIGFAHMAVKILHPRALRMTFDYEAVLNHVGLDAVLELMKRIKAGEIAIQEIDETTLSMIKTARTLAR